MTRYGFRSAIGAFFHAPTQGLAALLPPGLHVLESHPSLGVLALTVFDFDESEVGPYRELVASVLVPPHAARAGQFPNAAFFPILLATTSEASRVHAAQRWRLPKLEFCVEIEFEDEAGERPKVMVRAEGERVLQLEVEPRHMQTSSRLYQCFSRDPEQVHRVEITIDGCLSEHEEESGELRPGPHSLGVWLDGLIDDLVPFREQLMGRGEQRFGALTTHAGGRRSA